MVDFKVCRLTPPPFANGEGVSGCHLDMGGWLVERKGVDWDIPFYTGCTYTLRFVDVRFFCLDAKERTKPAFAKAAADREKIKRERTALPFCAARAQFITLI